MGGGGGVLAILAPFCRVGSANVGGNNEEMWVRVWFSNPGAKHWVADLHLRVYKFNRYYVHMINQLYMIHA